MSTPIAPQRPGRGWYVVATGLAVIAAALIVFLAVWIGRAVAGYSVTPFEQEDSTTVTVGDRGVAIWVSPQDTPTSCVATDIDTQQPSLDGGSASKVTITDGGQTWSRVGIVKGQPGSKHLVRCDPTGDFGYADNPRIGRYVLFGVGGGVLAVVSGIAAFVIVLVVAIKRNRTPRPA
ncbi:hypothetical protein [Aeromicrobium ginsengisoli]|uniref:Uncharacterized protein n=1 Tax=Aeromicrobium ginsengisoli TaxID=363867 RepID=A0A5M4FE49_9ACTN|nr:hypothetical protein [Aeromicrobium ginsengisoli]KAA1397509.1 hypothetical protein ESP70_009035 [Aeromicrobium ginsengisoli]